MAVDWRRAGFWLLLSALVTIGATVVLWSLTGRLVGFVGLLFLPLLPVLFRPRRGTAEERAEPSRACPVCGYSSADPETRFCPRHGETLR